MQAATQLQWMDPLPELFFSEAASLAKAAIAAAVSFAATEEQIQQVIRAGLLLEVPASQRFFLTSVVRIFHGNSHQLCALAKDEQHRN